MNPEPVSPKSFEAVRRLNTCVMLMLQLGPTPPCCAGEGSVLPFALSMTLMSSNDEVVIRREKVIR